MMKTMKMITKDNKNILLVCLSFGGMIAACVLLGLGANYLCGDNKLLSCALGAVAGVIVGYVWTVKMMRYIRSSY